MCFVKFIAMTTQEIANKLVDLCKKGEWETAQRELYADDVVSIEPYATEDFQKETKGLQAIIEKGRKFDSMVQEVHSLEVSEPLVATDSIAFKMTMDITMKGKGRMAMPELCVYEVKDGKIVSERFFV
jgi:ketosteroid isomerase-like protein